MLSRSRVGPQKSHKYDKYAPMLKMICNLFDTVPHTHFVDSVMTPFVDSVTHFVDSVTHFVDSATHLLIL